MSVALPVAVRARGVTKEFGEGEAQVRALRGADLDVFENELLIVSGPSGCGKTTLISILAAIMTPTEGRAEVFGVDVSTLAPLELARFRARTIGFVFQQFNLLPALTSAENVSVPLVLAGVPRKEAVERAAQVLAKVGLGNKTGSFPRELSGGQQQRVAVARALVHEPRLIVCDEPTSALDAASGRQVMELLRTSVAGPGRALVVVTHDARAFPFADRIAEMSDGRVEHVSAANDALARRAAHDSSASAKMRGVA